MKLEVLVDMMMQENTYILYDENTREAVVVDPAMNFDGEKSIIESKKLNVKYILLTHSHADHIGDVESLKNITDAKVVAHIKEKEMLNDANKNLSIQFYPEPVEIDADIYVSENEKIPFADGEFEFIFTPGHTTGCMCIKYGDIMFTGDTLFKGSIGRTDLYGGDYEKMLDSLRKLSKLNDEIKIYPGHGPASTIGMEKKDNYYMKLIV